MCITSANVDQGHFFMRTLNSKANIHIVPFQFVKNSYFKVLQGSVATLFRWSWKILSYFVANLSKTLHINFYQNRSSIVEVMITKLWCVFYAPQCNSIIMRYNIFLNFGHFPLSLTTVKISWHFQSNSGIEHLLYSAYTC